MTGDELTAEARSLRADVAALATAIEGLAPRAELEHTVAKTDRTARRTRGAVIGLVVSLLLELGITGYLAYGHHRDSQTVERVDQNQRLIAAIQARTSDEALCPLFGLFLASYRPESQSPERRAAYEETFVTLRRIYSEVLDCG